MAYEIKNKEEHLKKIREELEHNYCASELNIKFYRDVVIPKKQKVVADEKDKGKLRVATAELTSVQERLGVSIVTGKLDIQFTSTIIMF